MNSLHAGMSGLRGNPLRGLTDERPAGATLQWRVVLRVLAYTQSKRRKRNFVFFLTVVRAFQKPILAWALAAVIKGPIAHGDFRGTVLGTAGFAAILVLTEVVFHLRQRGQLELGEWVVHELRNDLFRNLQRMPLGYYHKTKLGRILSGVITDIEAVRRGLQQVFFFSVLTIGQMVVASALMLYYNWILFCLLLAVAPIVWAANLHFHPRFSRFSRAAAESSSRLTGYLAESVRGIRVIQGFTRERRGEAVFGGLVEGLASDNVRFASESALYTPLLDFYGQAFMAALLLVGGAGVLHHWPGMDVGSLIAFFFIPAIFFQSLQQLGTLYTQSVTSMASAERVFQLIDLKPEWEDAPNARDLPDPRPNRRDPAAAGGAQVEFASVTFGYEPGRPVLHGISFVARPGTTTALVGHTGSGKTTIVNLVAKFYPAWTGEIRIDGWNVAGLRSDSIRCQVGLVAQANFLFTGSVMDNIRLGRPAASDAEVVEAILNLDCLDLLESLPAGLATEAGEGGSNLSLGQRQVVCFARALLSNPRILILDEATSAVDPITEARLQRALGRLLAGRTSFVVAHRLSTVVAADQILMLERGRLVEIGRHRELLSKRGAYWSLYRRFAFGGEEDRGGAQIPEPSPESVSGSVLRS